MANDYQMRLKDMNFNEQIKELTAGFKQELEEMEMKLQKVTSEKDKSEVSHDQEVGLVLDK